MKKNLPTLFYTLALILTQATALAQWQQKAMFGGAARSLSAAFSIGTKIYLCGGNDNNISADYKDFWEYDVLADTWTQKADFPGGFRAGATAFTIGGKGYMGTGGNGWQYVDDFWEYDPVADTWTQKANFPGGAREEATGFSIGNKGYMGTGQLFVTGPNSSFTTNFNDFYEYDPATNTWTQKANFPGANRAYAASCAIGSKGYMGFGGNNTQTASFSDFYEYDPATNTWTQKSSGTGYSLADASMFVLGTDAYLFGGINFANFSASPACRKYNSATDTWSNTSAFSGGIIAGAPAVTSNGNGYTGTGYNASLNTRKDWWQFTPPASTVIATAIGEEPVSFQAVSLYPNPAADRIQVSLNANLFKNQSTAFVITDLLGREVISGELTWNSGSVQSIALPQNMVKGIYTFTLRDAAQRRVAIARIVKE